jgi:hypothetical protein
MCLACVVGIWPQFAIADPETKPSKEAPKTASADAENKAGENAAKSPASSKAKPDAANKANKAAQKTGEFNAEKETAALDFAAQHHPELVSLITPLKTSNPKEYQHAVRELFRTSERLSGIRVKDPARYQLELDAWKLQSQIRLLTARLTMATDSEMELQLRDAIKKKTENQLNLLQNERETLQARIEHVQKEIDRTSQSQDQLVQQEYDRLLKKSARDRNAIAPKSNTAKPAGNKKGNAAKSPSTTSVKK